MVRREVEEMTAAESDLSVDEVVEYFEVCGEDDLWDGEMESFDVVNSEVLVVKFGGEWCAYDGICPHQSVSLVEGELTEDGKIVCRAHQWTFNAQSGKGINPSNACLKRFPIKIEGGVVSVGNKPKQD
jgi:nitrite reductase/ring-hydroxylating ferredoxin subunit